MTQEFYPILFLLAFILLLLEAGLARWEFALRSTFFVAGLSLFYPQSLWAESVENELKLQIENTKDKNTRSYLEFNLGVEYYKKQNIEGAMEQFLETSYSSENSTLRKKALFNLLKSNRPKRFHNINLPLKFHR